jgi:hypothetical protein
MSISRSLSEEVSRPNRGLSDFILPSKMSNGKRMECLVAFFLLLWEDRRLIPESQEDYIDEFLVWAFLS